MKKPKCFRTVRQGWTALKIADASFKSRYTQGPIVSGSIGVPCDTGGLNDYLTFSIQWVLKDRNHTPKTYDTR